MIQTFSDICWHPLPWPLSCVMIAHTPVSGFPQPLLSRARWACDPRGPAQPGRLTWLPSPDLPPDLPKNFLSGTVRMSPGASHPPGGPGLVPRLLLRRHPGSGGEPPGSCVRKWHLPSGTFTTACLEEVWSPPGTSSQPPQPPAAKPGLPTRCLHEACSFSLRHLGCSHVPRVGCRRTDALVLPTRACHVGPSRQEAHPLGLHGSFLPSRLHLGRSQGVCRRWLSRTPHLPSIHS